MGNAFFTGSSRNPDGSGTEIKGPCPLQPRIALSDFFGGICTKIEAGGGAPSPLFPVERRLQPRRDEREQLFVSMMTKVKVVLALCLCQLLFAGYAVLSKLSLNTGMDPGLFVLVRDVNTAWIIAVASRVSLKSWRWPEPRHQLPFFTLGALGLYFGQYFSVQGIKYGTPVLAGIWQNVIPATTFLVGLALGTEKVQCNTSSILQVAGVALGVGGAVATSYAPEVSASGGSAAKACAFYALQVLFGGAGFWHLQKRLLTTGYRSIEVVAWYYFYGIVLMGMVVLPSALEPSLWRFTEADWIALAYGLAVWPLAAFLLAWSNDMATP